MKRLITAAIGVPATILLTLWAPTWLFALAIATAGALCHEELLGLGASRLDSRPGRWVILLGAGVTLSFTGGVPLALMVLTFSILLAVIITSFSASLQEAFPKAALGIMGIFYCGLLPGFLVHPRRFPSRRLQICRTGISRGLGNDLRRGSGHRVEHQHHLGYQQWPRIHGVRPSVVRQETIIPEL